MSRIVRGLIWAKEVGKRPSYIPASRARGKKAEGVRYERKLAKALPGTRHGVWFEFEDSNGKGCCQADLLLELGNMIVVLEAKYSWVAQAYQQIEQLYVPVISLALGRRVVGLQVCKNLRTGAGQTRIATGLGNAAILAASGRRVTWQWLPDTPVRLTEDQKAEIAA